MALKSLLTGREGVKDNISYYDSYFILDAWNKNEPKEAMEAKYP